MKKVNRGACLIIALGILFSMIPVADLTLPVSATEPAVEDESCSFVQIPEVMEDDEELLKTPVLRLDTDEDQLNVIRYLAGFDSQKVIVFPVNIKYTDAEGTVRDKSNRLYPSDDIRIACETRDNDITTRFPYSSKDGIVSIYGDHSVTLMPDSENDAVAEGDFEGHGAITYRNVFGDNADLRVMPTFTGNKTDIVLNDVPDAYVFRMKVSSPGCILIEDNGTVSLVKNGDIVCSFSEIFIKLYLLLLFINLLNG